LLYRTVSLKLNWVWVYTTKGGARRRATVVRERCARVLLVDACVHALLSTGIDECV
jgi:hypothetical protein